MHGYFYTGDSHLPYLKVIDIRPLKIKTLKTGSKISFKEGEKHWEGETMFANVRIFFYIPKVEVLIVPRTKSTNEQSVDKVLICFQ